MIDTKTEISKVFEGRPYVEQDYSDSEIAKIDIMLDKICRKRLS